MIFFTSSKYPLIIRVIIALCKFFVGILSVYLIWFGIVSYFEKHINKLGSTLLFAFFFVIAIVAICYDIFSKHGVYVFDNCIQIKNGLFSRRYFFNDITDVRLSNSFRSDSDARIGARYKNILVGNTKFACVKIQHGAHWWFMGVEDAAGLSKEIAKHIYKTSTEQPTV